jgi:predicted transcriptional regulator
MYVLNRNELRVFESISKGVRTTADLAKALGLSAISVYRAVELLSSSKMIEARRTGKRLRLSLSAHGHSKALAAYLEGGGRPIDPLVGSRFLVLISVSSNPKSLDRVTEEVGLRRGSVRRIVWALKDYGAISQDKRTISIPQSDTTLLRFLQDFSKGACTAILESIAPMGTVLWSEGLEFLFSTRTPVKVRGVSETGITAMSRRGLRFISDTRYYHYAYIGKRLRKEDIALHQILIDPSSTRNISYSLLLLMKEGYDPTYLAKQGDALAARVLADQIARYLSGGDVDNPYFPTRSDMAELRAQYGVS